MKKQSKKVFPKPVPFKQLIGPSFIILALGLGSGEVILWPYMVSNYGLGIAWGAFLGITFQYFINMEIERYALVKGESVFVGIAKIFPKAVYWFIFSTFIGFGLPGIIAASAQVFGSIIGVEQFKWIAIIFLLLIGIILSVGKTVYTLMEGLTRTIILIGVPFVFVLTIVLSQSSDWGTLFQGLMGKGEGYTFFPAGISFATFLAAFAYSGAAGNLNLTQSIYVKEKGYGMGKYAQKIAGLFASKDGAQKIKLTGTSFVDNKEHRARFNQWWKMISIEHGLIFWFVGLLSMCLLMLLAYVTVYGSTGTEEGILFVIYEGAAIGSQLFPAVGVSFLFVVGVMLFQTQLGVMDSTSRIMAENVAIKQVEHDKKETVNLSKLYYIFLWAQIGFGILLFLFNIYEPKTLLVLAAVINAFAMFVHVGLVFVVNHKLLPKAYRPRWWRKIVMIGIFLFFGFFSGLVLIDKLF
ncbi:Nramp family divalent metal transporter [Patescibacteria group bacterium]|nr:Nramp family divalent metal transporter [Patescibacteria group bacterium]MBU1721882.1 Nramp family divalent metal transporter [Patescibacteria group bacterium]MBU1901340.1 Nramp family divalent metal transporter [Patescibacteria group bacterium]